MAVWNPNANAVFLQALDLRSPHEVQAYLTFPGIGVIGVKSWQKTRKNRGQSESSPRCGIPVGDAVSPEGVGRKTRRVGLQPTPQDWPGSGRELSRSTRPDCQSSRVAGAFLFLPLLAQLLGAGRG